MQGAIGVNIIDGDNKTLVAPNKTKAFIICSKHNSWSCELSDWQDISPTQQYTAELLSALIPNACTSLERSIHLAQTEAQAERERIEQQHLIELGGLTAAIAHELRNPLNIINMAAAQTDEKIRTAIT